MKRLDLRKILCVTAMSLMPLLAIGGGTNAGDTGSTGYQNDPDKATKQGDMGSKDVTTNKTQDSSQTSVKVDDATLNKQVEDAIKADAMLNNLKIKVKTHDGVVTLSGDAKDVRWKGQAAKVASSIPGVKSVQNNLTVGSEKSAKDKKSPTSTNSGDSSQY